MQRKQFISTIKDAGGRNRRFVVSTANPDRDNDIISASGWHLDNYRKNPVVLWAHDYSSLPIAKCVDIGVSGGALVATAQFADHDLAETVLRLVDGGFLNATSVGFRPITYRRNEARGGFDFDEQELLEFSVVPVPANPEALIVMRSALAKWMGGGEDVLDIIDDGRDKSVLDLDDDEVDLDPVDLVDALAATLPAIVAEQREALVRREVDRQLAVIGDPAAARVRSAGFRQQLAALVAEETARAVRRALGRID